MILSSTDISEKSPDDISLGDQNTQKTYSQCVNRVSFKTMNKCVVGTRRTEYEKRKKLREFLTGNFRMTKFSSKMGRGAPILQAQRFI